jgi:hypothetical protein
VLRECIQRRLAEAAERNQDDRRASLGRCGNAAAGHEDGERGQGSDPNKPHTPIIAVPGRCAYRTNV